MDNTLERPYKSYIKRSLGKLYVRAWDQFSGTGTGIILEGDPNEPDDRCIVDVYNEKEDAFLKKNNTKHFQMGDLVEYERKEREISEEEKFNSMPDDEMKALLGKPFLAIQNAVNKFTSVPPLYALLQHAKDLNKSEKITKLIEVRIAAIQEMELPSDD